jgi:CRP/FNR family transcriptional regulator, nitrogen oxide reductase regulator
MIRSELLDCLQANPVFAELTIPVLEELLDASTVRSTPANGLIIRQGDPADAFGILYEGRAKMVQVTQDGRQVLLRYIVAGQEFGLIAVLPGFAYPLTIEAVEDCRVLFWAGPILRDAFLLHPQIGLNGLRIMATRNQELQARYRELLTDRVEQRLARALVRLAHIAGEASTQGTLIALRLSREDLAELIGTTLYTVSRTLSQWEQAGFVATGRERIVVCAPAELEQIAGEAEPLPASCVAPCALVEMLSTARKTPRPVDS